MPTTLPSASATSRWWRSRCERKNGPARSGPMTAAASAMSASPSAAAGERISNA